MTLCEIDKTGTNLWKKPIEMEKWQNMTEAKCDKCGALTMNKGNLFRCGSGMVDYNNKGAKLVKTTTSYTETRHCVLCDACINQYAEKVKKGKGNYTVPIIGMILSAVICGLFSLMGGWIRIVCLIAIAVYWISAIREILKTRKKAIAEAEAAKSKNPALLTITMERDAEMAYLKQFNTMVVPVGSFQEIK